MSARGSRFFAIGIAIAILLTLPLWIANSYYVNIASQILLWAVAALALMTAAVTRPAAAVKIATTGTVMALRIRIRILPPSDLVVTFWLQARRLTATSLRENYECS